MELTGGLLTAALAFAVLMWLSPSLTLLTVVCLGVFSGSSSAA